jgi:hypothetical protein
VQAAPLILIEFNELCPTLIERFMDQGILPNFQRFYSSATVFTTDAGEDEPNLEPWIQWPTVHSGMSFAEHRIFHLGDGRRLHEKCVAELLSDAGIPIGVCGSMNTNYGRLNGYVLPDPWDKDGVPHPELLTPFFRTVARQVQESSREGGLSKNEMLRLGLFLMRYGLTLGTARAVVAQLLAEQRDPGVRWRRALLLDRIQYDVFRHLNRRYKVRFATFFANTTAHFQHYYWRNMEPERFDSPPPHSDHTSLREAIRAGYRSMDVLLGRFLEDYPEAVLVLCTALSQRPWTETTKCTFRPRNFEVLLEFAGVSGASVKPVMAEQFHVECPNASTADLAEARFRALVLDGEPLMTVRRAGNNLFTGCRVTDAVAMNRPVKRCGDDASRRFDELFYMIHTVRSGRHDPAGALWMRNNSHQIVTEPVPLIDVAPTLLAHFGVEQPHYMSGRPLLPRWDATPDLSFRETMNQREARNPNGVTPHA